MKDYDYGLFVIGAGSGGVRAARMAAGLGVKVAVAEDKYLGGTCVNVGCVPKKLFVYASQFKEEFEAAEGFGWSTAKVNFDWEKLMEQKNQEITRLQGVYSQLLENSNATLINGKARLIDEHTVNVAGKHYHCEHILIATGGWPSVPDIAGKEYISTSNDIFELDKLPRRILIVGGGYIAVEFACILNGLGVETTISYRGDKLLRGFDEDIRDFLLEEMLKKGIDIRLNSNVSSISQSAESLLAQLDDENALETDLVLYATGRTPNTIGLGIEALGIELDEKGAVKVNKVYQTNVSSIYALGDVTNRINLTPVATAEAMALIDHLFTDKLTTVEYDNIPTAVFSQPNLATVGMTETQANCRYQGDIDIFLSTFKPMKHTLSGIDEKMFMKMIVRRSTDQVIGVHMVGESAGEIIQGMAVAIRAGATKAIFDSTIGIHPTAAEEFVTMRS